MESFAQAVGEMQGAISCLGIFVCTWGFSQHCSCLWKVLFQRALSTQDSHCIRHAYVAMLCVSGIVFALARLNTIGYFHFGNIASGLAYMAGMLIMVVTIGLAVWAKKIAHRNPETYAIYLRGGLPAGNVEALTKILTALLIVTLAFVAVGLLNIGR